MKLGRYRHYSGREYDLIGLAKDSETMGKLVVYRARYGKHELWVRPLAMFIEDVEVDGHKVPRFVYLGK